MAAWSRSAGLAELVCDTAADYVERAVALGHDGAAVAGYRDRLLAGRDTNTLFDTPATVRGLERLYAQMWSEFEAGTVPQPDLANLDVLLELGSVVDHEAIDLATMPDYAAWWQERLQRRHQFRPIPAGTRGMG